MWKLRPAVVHCYNPRPIIYGGVAARLSGIRATVGSLSAFACLIPDRDYPFLPQQLLSGSLRNRLRNRVAAHLMRYVVAISRSLGRRFFAFWFGAGLTATARVGGGVAAAGSAAGADSGRAAVSTRSRGSRSCGRRETSSPDFSPCHDIGLPCVS